MEETYFTEALVLNRTPFREFDEKVVLYTKDFGKIELVARGAKKIKSKLSGHIEPITLINIMAIKGRQYDYLGSSINEESFINIKNNLSKTIVASKAIKIFNELIKSGEEDSRLYSFFVNFLLILNKKKLSNYNLTYEIFMLKLLDILGNKPELKFCLNCMKKVESEISFFIFKKGGIICSDCQKNIQANKIKLSNENLKTLKHILSNNFTEIFKLKIDKKNSEEVKNFILLFSQFNN